MRGSLYIISAASGAGKTSLVSKLLEKDSNIKVSVSTTTRACRPGEQDGVNYHFVSVAEFQTLEHQGEFLECAQVFDNFYGTSKAAVETLLNDGKDVILEIDWQGAELVRKLIPEAISIFILPPSLTELERRLTGRGTDSEAVIARRMSAAISEMSHYIEFDYVVINNHFETALNQLHSIFTANRLRTCIQKDNHRSLIQSLLDPTQL